MEGPQMLSGSQLVAAGVTKNIDGELPELGSKEVSPNGSWVEQKQIQSALEARKCVIEVERIEKVGSLSHAIWRDDLKLAEVTQQVGSYWQYIGHNIGKQLYLRPEEALFLIEVNSLLLKHNDVTVSTQKAYSLCLGDISIQQYKVYASLSRLGYRVFRHKESTPNDKTKGYDETIGVIKDTETYSKNGDSPSNCINVPCVDGMDDHSVANQNCESSADANIRNGEASFVHSDDYSYFMMPLVPADTREAEIYESNDGSEMIENSINTVIEKTLKSAGITPGDLHKGKSDEILPMVRNTHATTQNQNINMLINNEEVGSSTCIVETCMNTFDDTTATIDVDDNANERIIRGIENNENINMDFSAVTDVSNVFNPGAVYSVDEFGQIQIYEEASPTVLKVVESNNLGQSVTQKLTIVNSTDPGSSTNDQITHYEKDNHHYKTKIQNLIKRKANAVRRSDLNGFNSMQDFYQQRIVNVNVPEEKYLPRNIFLHKAVYMYNMDIVSKQNASNANIAEYKPEQMENRTEVDRGVNPPNLANLFIPNLHFNGPPRYNNPYPPYRPNFRPHAWVRHSYNAYFNYNSGRPPNYMYYPRYRYHPHSFNRQRLMNYNQSAEMRKRHQMKMFHFNTIVNTASRFKSILEVPSNLELLKNLLRSFNSQYGENYELTPHYDIVQGNIAQEDPEVIVLDDEGEPKRKKRRVSDTRDPMNSNLVKLKSLAAKLKDLHAKNLAVSRHRRVFSNAIKQFNKSFKADLYLDTNFEIKDKKLIILDSSSDSDAVIPVKENKKSKKKIKLNPFNILKRVSKNVNVGASTSREVPILQQLSLNVINEGGQKGTDTPIVENDGGGLLKYFDKVWLPSDDNFGRAELSSRDSARFDTLLFEAQKLYDNMKKCTEFQSWLDLKIFIVKEIQRSTILQEQRAIALNNDFLMETESQLQPIIGSDCTDLRSALNQLAIISTDLNEIPYKTSLKIDFDVCNRDIHFKKTNPPKPNFRVICWDESKSLPFGDDIAALQAKYDDGVPSVFAIIGSGSISYLQINALNLPLLIPDNDSA